MRRLLWTIKWTAIVLIGMAAALSVVAGLCWCADKVFGSGGFIVMLGLLVFVGFGSAVWDLYEVKS